MQDLFADRFINLNIHRGIVRLDFARLEKLDPEQRQATFSPSVRVVMPMDAFMQMADQINKVREAILQQANPDTPASAGKPIQ